MELLKFVATSALVIALIVALAKLPGGKNAITAILWLLVLVSIGIQSKRIASLFSATDVPVGQGKEG